MKDIICTGMFKIRSPKLDDYLKLESLFKDHPLFIRLNKNKFISCLQSLIPYNLRTLPSVHLAVEEKEILGFIILSSAENPNNVWQINEVFVLDEIRKHGVGEELVRYSLSIYGGYGVEHFLAEVDSQNFPALSLFHQCGFRRYAKVYFYENNIDLSTSNHLHILDKDFIIRPQIKNDLTELEKIDLSIIPPDLRVALGRSKKYFKETKDSLVLIDKKRNIIIGWAQLIPLEQNSFLIEILASPGWTHLYEQFLNTLIIERIPCNNFKLTIKATDYNTDLSNILTKSGFLPREVKELLVRTIWNKSKEKQKKTANVGAPSIAPT